MPMYRACVHALKFSTAVTRFVRWFPVKHTCALLVMPPYTLSLAPPPLRSEGQGLLFLLLLSHEDIQAMSCLVPASQGHLCPFVEIFWIVELSHDMELFRETQVTVSVAFLVSRSPSQDVPP